MEEKEPNLYSSIETQVKEKEKQRVKGNRDERNEKMNE
jgi:hypothetical protein